MSLSVGGFNLPGNRGRLLARQQEALGSQMGAFRADLERPLASPSPTPCLSGILQLARFPARGIGQSSGEEPAHLLLPLALSLGGCRRDNGAGGDFHNSLNLEGTLENTLEVLQVKEGVPRAPGCFLQGRPSVDPFRPVSDGFLVV